MERRESTGTVLSLGSGQDSNIEPVYEEYVKKYGEENADYLMEVMGAWQSHYNRAVYIDMGVSDGSAIETQTKEEAKRRNWSFDRLTGNLALIRRLLNGDWEKDFLVVPPGEAITMAYDDAVVSSVKYTSTAKPGT